MFIFFENLPDAISSPLIRILRDVTDSCGFSNLTQDGAISLTFVLPESKILTFLRGHAVPQILLFCLLNLTKVTFYCV